MPAPDSTPRQRPELTFWQVWNLCFGFLGIQFGFALQNANASRIFQTLGASVDDIPMLWIAAPLTGLLVQPVVGYLSDRTWGALGRRRPYFLVGAVLVSRLVGLNATAAGLLPIAAGYLVAHYFTYILIDGQRIVVALADPLQQGWDIGNFGFAFFEPSQAWLPPGFVWTVQLAAVVGGHMLGAWAGHCVAARESGAARGDTGHRRQGRI